MRRGAGKTRRMMVLKQKTKKEREEGRKKRVFLVGGGGENIIYRVVLVQLYTCAYIYAQPYHIPTNHP